MSSPSVPYQAAGQPAAGDEAGSGGRWVPPSLWGEAGPSHVLSVPSGHLGAPATG